MLPPPPPSPQILRSGRVEAARIGGANPYLGVCREAGVREALLQLNHAPANISNKALAMGEAYFSEEEDDGDGNGGGD